MANCGIEPAEKLKNAARGLSNSFTIKGGDCRCAVAARKFDREIGTGLIQETYVISKSYWRTGAGESRNWSANRTRRC